MDWFSWVAKTGLEGSLIYEYGLAFTQNELEEEDISYFNHEFLQSMGISIAKHRLEILKLAKKHKKKKKLQISRLAFAIKKSKSCLVRFMKSWIHHQSSQALVVVPKPTLWRPSGGSMLKRNNTNKKMLMNQQHRLLLPGPVRVNSFSSPVVLSDHHHDYDDEKQFCFDADVDNGSRYWSTRVEEIRWDAMFQNLKPT